MTRDEYLRLVDLMNAIADQAKYIRNNLVADGEFKEFLIKEVHELKNMINVIPNVENFN